MVFLRSFKKCATGQPQRRIRESDYLGTKMRIWVSWPGDKHEICFTITSISEKCFTIAGGQRKTPFLWKNKRIWRFRRLQAKNHFQVFSYSCSQLKKSNIFQRRGKGQKASRDERGICRWWFDLFDPNFGHIEGVRNQLFIRCWCDSIIEISEKLGYQKRNGATPVIFPRVHPMLQCMHIWWPCAKKRMHWELIPEL